MKFNIQLKVILTVVLLVSFLLLGIYFYLNKQLREFVFRRTETSLIQETFLARSYLEQREASFSSLKPWDEVADTLGKTLDVRVTIIDSQGVVLGDSSVETDKLADLENHLLRPEFQQALSKGQGQVQRYSTTLHRESLYFAVPFGEKHPRGFVRLSVALSDIDIISANLRKLLLYACICFFVLLTISLGAVLNILIVKPIREISSVTDEIALGNFSRKISLRTRDEIND